MALPLADKLLNIGKRVDAIKAAETALGRVRDEFYHFEYRDTREDLLRFLVKTCDPGMTWPDHGFGLQFTCEKNGATYTIDADSIEWVEPLPEGFEWIEAYFAWTRNL